MSTHIFKNNNLKTVIQYKTFTIEFAILFNNFEDQMSHD